MDEQTNTKLRAAIGGKSLRSKSSAQNNARREQTDDHEPTSIEDLDANMYTDYVRNMNGTGFESPWTIGVHFVQENMRSKLPDEYLDKPVADRPGLIIFAIMEGAALGLVTSGPSGVILGALFAVPVIAILESAVSFPLSALKRSKDKSRDKRSADK